MINIEIGKSWRNGKFQIRIGNIDGCTEHSNIDKEEVLQDIIEALDEMSKYKCDNCGVNEVEHREDWCDDCNLPERSKIK